MFQSALIFALGFLAAALLALMVAPAIWRRAVYLTRKRIEAALPLTVNELNAEKDALRAEHAMAMRRMELRLKDTREHGTSEKVLVEEQSGRIKALESSLADAMARSAARERETAELTEKLHERVTELSELSVLLESARTELDIRTSELKAATRLREDRAAQLREVSSQLQTTRDDLGERETQMETLYETIAELKASGKNLKREVQDSNTDGQAVGDMLASESRRVAKAEAKLELSNAKVAALEEKLKKREADIKELRERSGTDDAELVKLQGRVDMAEKAKAELGEEIERMSSRIEEMTAAFEGRDPSETIEELEAKLAKQVAAANALELERDSMKVELAVANLGASSGSGEGDAILREKLNDLAAEVVAMAARLEGPDSRIHVLLDQEKPSASSGDIVSLAERIKALQRSANGQRSTA